MTAWLLVCVIGVGVAAPHLWRARRIARQPLFPTWVRPEADEVSSTDEVAVAWSALDDRQLTRLLVRASSSRDHGSDA